MIYLFFQAETSNGDSVKLEMTRVDCSGESPYKMLPEELSNSRRKSSNPRKIKRDNSIDTEQSNHSVNEEADSPEEESSISCLLCGRIFENRKELRKHILIGHGIDPAEVGYPDLEMDEMRASREHFDESEMAESMLEAETVFCCEVCIREFNDRASLWLHMLYSHREEAATACGICLRVCSDNVSLLEHVDSCHPRETLATDKRRYSCQICARQHDSRKKLLVHVKIHNLKDADGRALDPESMVVLNSDFYGPEAPPSNECVLDDEFSMSCEMCYKTFPTELKLIKHKRNAHKDSEAMHSTNSSATYKLFFPCEMCGLSHSTRTERWRHVFSCHADEPSLVCQREGCWKVFPTRALQYEHVSSHHDLQGDSPNTCEICGKLWATRMNYWKHMMGVHSDCLPFICGVCLKVFCNVSDLANHVKDKHYPLDNSEEFCCDICGRPYSKKSKMSRHRKIHNLPCSEGGFEDGVFDMHSDNTDGFNDPGALKCKECPTEQFLDLEELSEHRRSAHNLVPCDLCPKYYGRTSHLWKHVYKIHKTHPDITCNICQKTSASKFHLSKHYAKHHRSAPEENNYVTLNDVSNSGDIHNCSKCNKVFRKDHLMRQHLKHCTGPKPINTLIGSTPSVNGSFPCEKCKKVFDTPSILRKHVKSSHIIYTCEICEVSKDSRTELFNHIKAEHLNHPDLTCDVTSCLKMLRVKKDLIKHKREHRQGYPPPTCEFCGELLANRLKLRKHLRSNHTEQSKYLCSICTVSHLRFEDLQEHIKENHPSSIGKPNTCTICARKFPTKYKLEVHLKVHGNEFFHCLTCFEVFRKEEDFNAHSEIHPPKKLSTPKIQEEGKDSNAESDDEEGGKKRSLSPGTQSSSKVIKLVHNCVCCKETFTTKSELSKHQLETHSSLKCSICLAYFESEDVLANHKITCKPSEGRVKRRSALNSLIFNKSIERVLNADSDDELSATNRSSVNSVDDNSSSSKDLWTSGKYTSGRKVYENDNSFSPCEHCEKTWPMKRALWQHLIRSHRPEAATTCGVCLKSCGSYYDLDMHLVEEHPTNFEMDDSNSTCRVCGRYHNARHKLQGHAAIHAGDEERSAILQYDCSICDKSFSSRGFLIKHEKEEHNINVERKYGDLKKNEQSDTELFVNSISSDDDDSQFEGFPVESCETVTPFAKSLLKDVEKETSSPIEEFAIHSPDPELKPMELDSDSNSSGHSISPDMKLDPDNSNDAFKDMSVLDPSNKSESRDSFKVEELFEQNNTQESTSDVDKEDNSSFDCQPDVNKEDSELMYDIEDSVVQSNVINTVKSFQSVASLNQCSRQSASLDENSLQLVCSNDSSRYISQNITDSEMDNLVT